MRLLALLLFAAFAALPCPVFSQDTGPPIPFPVVKAKVHSWEVKDGRQDVRFLYCDGKGVGYWDVAQKRFYRWHEAMGHFMPDELPAGVVPPVVEMTPAQSWTQPAVYFNCVGSS